jgi:hypothetical protein
MKLTRPVQIAASQFIPAVRRDKKMKPLPTDLEILDAIYERYYETFASFSSGDKSRSTKVFVPVDIDAIAKDMGVDPDILFGRLYYHLEQKYGYKHEDGTAVQFFALGISDEMHCVNFPYMASVLAQLRDEGRKYRIATCMAIVSLVVSVAAVLISIFL